MIEILKLTLNWGFPAFFCILFYWDFRKKIISLDKTITNDLVHIIKKDSENTEKVEKAIDKLTDEISRLNDKK